MTQTAPLTDDTTHTDAPEKTVFIETFGCQMNQADTETVLARLASDGYRRVSTLDDASLVLYNTCSVRDNAEAKIRGRLDSLKPIKRRRELTIGVMGCMAQREQEQLLAKYPHLDLVVGTDQFVHMPELLRQLDHNQQLAATEFGDFESRNNWASLRKDGINAWIPVMRGCNYNCTYCVVPKTRGREKSRSIPMVEADVRQAVAEGFSQVTLLGQTVDAYGKTLGDGSTLAKLLRSLHEIDGLKRLRFVTSHPKDITDELLIAMAELPKVAKHLHVPAQSGSDRILRLMGRRYTRESYLAMVERARHFMPEIELLTDIIVGFPRETDDDFQATLSLMDEVGFAGAFVFMYSPRPGTGAWNLPDDIADEVKRARCNAAIAKQLAHQDAWYSSLHGRTYEVLVEGPSKSNDAMLCGRSIGNLNIVFPRQDANGHSRDALIGELAPITIERSTNLTLFGEIASTG